MAQEISLANHLLVAMPSMTDPMFEKSVIYICEHHQEGTIGLIINQPTEYLMRIVFEQMHLSPVSPEKNNAPLLFGGPIQSERGFVLHPPGTRFRSSLKLGENVVVTTSNDIIQAIAEGKGPQDLLVVLGYCGWEKNQLEEEVKKNAWLVCPFQENLLYHMPFSKRWENAALSIGVHMSHLSSNMGHA